MISFFNSPLISETNVVTMFFISSFFTIDVLIADKLWCMSFNSSKISMTWPSVSELLVRCNFDGLLSDTVEFFTDDGAECRLSCNNFLSVVLFLLFLFSRHSQRHIPTQNSLMSRYSLWIFLLHNIISLKNTNGKHKYSHNRISYCSFMNLVSLVTL